MGDCVPGWSNTRWMCSDFREPEVVLCPGLGEGRGGVAILLLTASMHFWDLQAEQSAVGRE